MHSTLLLSGAALLGIFSGLALARFTPTDPLPTKQPEWRGRAAGLRAETEALYAWSMPQELSPTAGYGNPAYHQAAVEVRYDSHWRDSSQLPAYPSARIEETRPVQTGNEGTIAELEALNESFDQPREKAGRPEEDQDLFGN